MKTNLTYIPIGSVHRLANPGKIPLELIEFRPVAISAKMILSVLLTSMAETDHSAAAGGRRLR